MDLLRTNTQRARKAHCCEVCGYPIEPGTVYQSATYVDDGIYDWREHRGCGWLGQHMADDGDYHEGYTRDLVLEWLGEQDPGQLLALLDSSDLDPVERWRVAIYAGKRITDRRAWESRYGLWGAV